MAARSAPLVGESLVKWRPLVAQSGANCATGEPLALLALGKWSFGGEGVVASGWF